MKKSDSWCSTFNGLSGGAAREARLAEVGGVDGVIERAVRISEAIKEEAEQKAVQKRMPDRTVVRPPDCRQ